MRVGITGKGFLRSEVNVICVQMYIMAKAYRLFRRCGVGAQMVFRCYLYMIVAELAARSLLDAR